MLYKENITIVTAHAHVSCSMHKLVAAHVPNTPPQVGA